MANEAAPFAASASRQVLYCPTLVIGAGPAGLAVGACLQQAGLDCLLLEQGSQPGSAWHHHYERLHLHTDKAHSGLPFLPFPKEYPRYPSRLQMISYLENYARQFQLEPRFGQQVLSARHAGACWEVRTRDARYQADNLVVATGYNREPWLPAWPGQSSFQGTMLHAARYRQGEAFRGQKVLVVGFGNSGGEIAIDLWEHGAMPSVSVRSAVNVVPRELFGIPILTIGIAQSRLPLRWADALNAMILRIAVGDLTRYGLRKPARGPLSQIHEQARVPLIDVGTIELIRQGHVAVRPGIERFDGQDVVFSDGSRMKFDAVILATGYRPRVNAFLEDALAAHDEHGSPLSSGRETVIPGLYFCGYHVSATGMLRDIGLEARRICASIARNPPGAASQ